MVERIPSVREALAHPTVASSLDTWAPSQHGGWVPKVNVPRNKKERLPMAYDPAQALTECAIWSGVHIQGGGWRF